MTMIPCLKREGTVKTAPSRAVQNAPESTRASAWTICRPKLANRSQTP